MCIRDRYRTLLLREPDAVGLAEWSAVLQSGKETGADIVSGFVFSKEFVGNDYSDEQYIEVLYNAILGRDVYKRQMSESLQLLKYPAVVLLASHFP